jgi:hypothetical protein
LSGAGGDVLEIGVVVQHHGAMVLGHRGGQQIDDAGGAVVAATRSVMRPATALRTEGSSPRAWTEVSIR